MKRTLDYRRAVLVIAGIMTVGLFVTGCHTANDATKIASVGSIYAQTNLVSNRSDFEPAPLYVDTNLLNAWGLAMDPAGNFGVAANHSGMDIFYDGAGVATLPAIQVPAADMTFPGAPSGQVYNSSNEFVIPGTNEKAKFIISTEDGIICAWASGPAATIVIPPLDTMAVYKGLAMAMLGGKNYLYATNFRDHRIDVFNGKWDRVMSYPFVDTTIPAEYSPFSITNIDNKLWVSYAIPKPPDFMDDTAGPGHGIINIFNPNGTFVRRFYSHGVLNSPWGITRAPAGDGSQQKVFLVGNFGDGKINAFFNSGELLGPLMTAGGDSIMIDGLWALMSIPGRGADKVYFTAGPNGENDGIFGYLKTEFPPKSNLTLQ